jgi:hypothetical protein
VQQERSARRVLGAALAELGDVDRRLAELRQSLTACRAESEGSAAALARAVEAGLLRAEVVQQRRRVVAAASVERAREAYRERRRDLRTIARMLELRREQWRVECLALEQSEMEEASRVRALALAAEGSRS